MTVQSARSSSLVHLALAALGATAVAVALSVGIDTNLRWTIYLLFVPIFFGGLFFTRSSLIIATVLIVPFVLLEGSYISYRYFFGVRTSVSLPIVLLFLLGHVSRERKLPEMGKYRALWFIVLAILGLELVPHLTCPDLEIALLRLQQSYVEGAVWFVAGLALFRTEIDFRRLLWVLILTGVALSFLHYTFVVTGTPVLDPVIAKRAESADWRYGGPLANPNNLAAYYAMFLPGTVLLAFVERRRLLKMLALVAAVCMAPSLFLTASRGGLLTAAVSVVLMFALARTQSGKGLALFPLIALVMAATYYLLVTRFADFFALSVERLQERGLEDVRTELWAVTIDMIVANPLGLGLSYTHFAEEIITNRPGMFYSTPHNIYLEFATVSGIPGLIAMLALVFSVFRDGLRGIVSRVVPRRDRGVMLAMLTALVAFLMAGNTEPVYFNGPKLNHIFWLVAGAVVVAWRRIQHMEEVAGAPAAPQEIAPKRRMLVGTVAMLGLALGLSGCGAGASAGRPDLPLSPEAIPVGDAPVEGPAGAPVTIVELSDFECPYCAKVQPTLRELQERYPGKLRLVFKNNPLGFHKQAREAALAGLAAQRQGRFAAMKALLFANQRALTADKLVAYAGQAGLDLAQFRTDVSDPLLKAHVDADTALAEKLSAPSTPTFFVNGQLLTGAKPLDAFVAIIDEELEKAERLAAYGVPADRVSEALTWLNLRAADVREPKTATRPKERPKAADPKLTAVGFSRESPRRGPDDALVTLVVFHDYQCPYCGRLDRTLGELEQRYPGQLRVVLRHLPLQFHKDARLAAEAAMAAGDQGRYWDFHAQLVLAPRELSRADLVRVARELGLDSLRFQDALDRGKFRSFVGSDLAEAARLGVTATPTCFVNGRIVRGAKPADDIARVIDAELARARQVQAEEGLHGDALYERLVDRE